MIPIKTVKDFSGPRQADSEVHKENKIITKKTQVK